MNRSTHGIYYPAGLGWKSEIIKPPFSGRVRIIEIVNIDAKITITIKFHAYKKITI